MASGDIEHKDIPDELLHEPKGAATASAGTTYIADGAGRGSFKKIPVSSLDMVIPSVTDAVIQDVTSTISLTGSGLAQEANGVLTDVNAFVGIPQEITSTINKNASEILRVYNNQKTINEELSQNIISLENKLNELLTACRSIGIIND